MERLGKLLCLFAVIHVFQFICIQCQITPNLTTGNPVYLVLTKGSRRVQPVSRGAYSSMASDPAFAFVGAPTVYECNFEQGLCNWTHVVTGTQFNWTRNQGPTKTKSTGPANDHTTGNSNGWYIYIETSPPRRTGDKAQLLSPLIRNPQTRCLSFWYHMNGDHVNELNVYVMRGSSSMQSLVWAKTGNQGNQWSKAEVTIIPTSEVVFEGVRGTGLYGDIAIDDIKLSLGQCQNIGVICGEPPIIERATISDGGNVEGANRTYSCNQNTSTEGNTTITCGPDGQWSSTDLYCRPICGEPPTIERATISDGGNVEGATRTYSCYQNTSTEGNTTITCGPNGQWSSTDLYCRPSCGPPPTIPRAEISEGDNLQGTTRTYFCLGNTIAIGKPTILCGKDGKWSKTDFRCLRKWEALSGGSPSSSSESSWDSSLEEYAYYTDI